MLEEGCCGKNFDEELVLLPILAPKDDRLEADLKADLFL